MASIIPLKSNTSQEFRLTLEGNEYDCSLRRNERMGVWMFSIRDADANSVIEGQALVLGQKILSQYNLGLGQFMVADTENTDIDATAEDLGSRVVFIYLTEEELAEGAAV
jgi:hypothetical protein